VRNGLVSVSGVVTESYKMAGIVDVDRTRIEEIVAEASGETPITIENRLLLRKR
jgi:hypothetical protein